MVGNEGKMMRRNLAKPGRTGLENRRGRLLETFTQAIADRCLAAGLLNHWIQAPAAAEKCQPRSMAFDRFDEVFKIERRRRAADLGRGHDNHLFYSRFRHDRDSRIDHALKIGGATTPAVRMHMNIDPRRARCAWLRADGRRGK